MDIKPKIDIKLEELAPDYDFSQQDNQNFPNNEESFPLPESVKIEEVDQHLFIKSEIRDLEKQFMLDEEHLGEDVVESKDPLMVGEMFSTQCVKRTAEKASEETEMPSSSSKKPRLGSRLRKSPRKIPSTVFYSCSKPGPSTSSSKPGPSTSSSKPGPSTSSSKPGPSTSSSKPGPSTSASKPGPSVLKTPQRFSSGSSSPVRILSRHDCISPRKPESESRDVTAELSTSSQRSEYHASVRKIIDIASELNISDSDSDYVEESSDSDSGSDTEIDMEESRQYPLEPHLEMEEEEAGLSEDEDVEPTDIDEEVTEKARSGYLWSNMEPPTSRTRARNICSINPRLHDLAARAATPLQCFEAYMQPQIIDSIVEYTNKYAREYVAARNNLKEKEQYRDTNEVEMRAFLGILIFMGVNKDTKEDLETLWDESAGRGLYRAAMAQRRFKALLSMIRFDDRQARRAQEEAGNPNPDKLSPLREIFDKFNNILGKSYTPGKNLCIDEMLCLFRGNAPFRVYINTKPGKYRYGLLLRILSDVDTKLILQTLPYGGPIGNTPSINPSEVVMHFAEPYFKSNRNITTDRYYTSVDLATKLYEKELTLVGAINTNRVHIPPAVKETKGREQYSTKFITSKKAASGVTAPILFASYVPKVKSARNVLLLSTMHSRFSVHDIYKGKENTKKKTEIIAFYNATIGAVDTADQMVRKYSTKRATRRWPLSWFFSILDICVLNSFIIYGMKDQITGEALRKKRKSVRVKHYSSLAMDLIRPNALERLKLKSISVSIRMTISEIFNVQERGGECQERNVDDLKRSRCAMCYKEAGNKREKQNVTKVKIYCNKCNIPCCPRHCVVHTICTICNAQEG